MKKQPKLNSLILLAFIPFILGLTTLADPTQPPGFASKTMTYSITQGPQLMAVFISPKGNMAIINGIRAKIGDHIGEYVVTSITPYTVELTGPKNRVEVLHLLTKVKEESAYKGF